MKTKQIYWLTQEATATDKKRSMFLETKGLETVFLANIKELIKRYESKRVSTIIISDNFSSSDLKMIVDELSKSPNLYGVRLILNSLGSTHSISESAYQQGFRDLVPASLPDKIWCKRVLFSSSVVDTRLPVPTPNIGLKAMAGIYVPTRLVWISSNAVKIESRIDAPVGTKINLVGPLTEKLGQKMLSLTVQDRETQNLRFRFGNALVCKWSPSREKQGKLKIILDHIKSHTEEAKVKIFFAVKSPSTRSQLLNSLDQPEYIVASALSRKHIIDEPRFFGPDLVFIEDGLCRGENLSLFSKMADNLPHSCPIVIIGETSQVEDLRSLAPSRKIHVLPRIRENMTHLIFQRFLKQRKANRQNPDHSLVPDNHALSHGELYFSARLTTVSPHAATLRTPIQISKFGLCRIESPFFKKAFRGSVISKITDSYAIPGLRDESQFFIDCHYSNISKKVSKNIARLMFSTLDREFDLGKSIEDIDELPHGETVTTPTPTIDIFTPEEIVENLAEGTKGVFDRLKSPTFTDWGLPIIAITIFFILMLKGLDWVREEYATKYQKSGRTFSEQLEKFQKTKQPNKGVPKGRPIKLFDR